jgi:hypothetical protein
MVITLDQTVERKFAFLFFFACNYPRNVLYQRCEDAV